MDHNRSSQFNSSFTKGKRKIAFILSFSLLTIGLITFYSLSQSSQHQNLLFYGESMKNEHQLAFMDFLVKYERSYSTKEDLNSRFHIFKKNYDMIQEHNKVNPYVKKEIDHLTDLTEEEFNQQFATGLLINKNRQYSHIKLQSQIQVNDAPLPEFVDWNAQGKVSIPQNQKSCGACWAFTTATTLESLVAIKQNLSKAPVYSVQYLVDCDPVNIGCGGGWMMDAYEYTQKNGIVFEEDYPYKYLARSSKCQKTEGKKRFFNVGAIEEDSISNQRMKEILVNQPVGVAMHSNQGCLMGYKSGIVHEKDCKCSNPAKETVNHAVTIVGYGKSNPDQDGRPDCQEYWIIKNSWGPHWGNKGFFKLCADIDEKVNSLGTCQVNSYVQYPTLD